MRPAIEVDRGENFDEAIHRRRRVCRVVPDRLWAGQFGQLGGYGHVQHHRRLVGHAVAGEIRLDVEQVPLDAVADAWRRQDEGPGTKIVVVP